MLHQKLSVYHHTLVTASLLFHEWTFFAHFSQAFEAGFLLKFGIWRERRHPLTQARSFVDVAVAPKTSGT